MSVLVHYAALGAARTACGLSVDGTVDVTPFSNSPYHRVTCPDCGPSVTTPDRVVGSDDE